MLEGVGYNFIDEKPKWKGLVTIDQERIDLHLNFNIGSGTLSEVIDQPSKVLVDRDISEFVVLVYVFMHCHHRTDAACNALARFVRHGLHIASEIARGHGGQITVDSTDRETRFTFAMPLI